MSNAGYKGKDGIPLRMAGFPGGKGDVCIGCRTGLTVIFIGPNITGGVINIQTVQNMPTGVVMKGEDGHAPIAVVTG